MTSTVPDVISAYFRLDHVTPGRFARGPTRVSPVNRGNPDNNRTAAPRIVLVGARASDIAT
jgi:hypothetical protein